MQGSGSRLVVKFALTILTLAVSCTTAWAQGNYQVIYYFGQHDSDGYQPWSGVLLDTQSNIYGNTEQGGRHGGGTVYKLVRNDHGGWSHATLYNFKASDPGYAPVTTMVRDQVGRLYGTDTTQIFEAAPAPTASVFWQLSVLHQFTGGADGDCQDLCSVSMDTAGNLYGSTPAGGAYSSGVVFMYGQAGYTVLYDFTGGDDGGYGVGQTAFDNQGNIYGTTAQGGAHGQGVVYRLSPSLPDGSSWTYSVLYTFGGSPDAATPWGGLMLAKDGNLYGTSLNGGTGAGGTVFRLTPNGDGTWSESVLYSFQQQGDGFGPLAVPTMDAAGSLYGTTTCGIEPNCYGTIYKLAPSSNGQWSETIVHAFQGGESDGFGPFFVPVAIDSAGNVFGTTTQGGPYNGGGVVWEYTP